MNEWFINTLLSRLDDKQNGAIILVMQRLHVDDLCGSLLRASNDWALLRFSAIAEEDEQVQVGEDDWHTRRAGDLLHPERQPKSVLDRIRAEMGSYNFAAQYQQCPVPLDGAIIKPTWFRRYDQPPARAASSRIIQSWDTASKAGAENYWSVCITVLIHEKKYYLLHVLRGRFDYPTLKARAISHAEAHKASRILVEDAGVGTALVAELQKAGLPAVAIKPEQNKRTRMSIQSSKIESGQFFVPTKQRGCLTLRQNCSRFRTHDMMIRSTPSAKHWLMGPNLMDGMRIQIRLSLRLFKDFAKTRFHRGFGPLFISEPLINLNHGTLPLIF